MAPKGRKNRVGAEQQNGQIQGAAPVSLPVDGSTCLFVPFTVPHHCLSVSLSLCVSLTLFLSLRVSLSPLSLPPSPIVTLCLFLSLPFCPCLSLSLALLASSH